MKYMLDTNIIAYAKNNRPEKVRSIFQNYDPKDLCISSITMAELEYGVYNSSNPAQNQMALILFLSGIAILPFDAEAAKEYGAIRALLKNSGTLIGANDMLIAAHAKALGLILVTNNAREFERVEGLRIENWV
ncbi:MAG: type II toxin-antitoxin system VapC family toxin [bacterium]|nr:type II toxin-antitoxin system VapC family toxin [bacterium]